MTIKGFFTWIFLSFFLTCACFAQGPKIGEFIMEATPADILNSDASKNEKYIGQDEKISWEIYVPENYDPANPPGIMVFAGAPRDVRPPNGWLATMRDKNLIWVAARNSNNGASIYQKEYLAMMSVPLITKDYQINQDRIYITGQARAAARAILNHPDIFDGAIFTGSRVWENNAEEKLKDITTQRFVFVTREKTNLPQGNRYAYYKFKNAGISNTELVYVPDTHRYTRTKFSRSIEYLDNQETIE
ncbi:MAG: hypothetical protein R3D86_12140 [Emcibacteraceae bacterium]